jgi:hypothetical protein
VSCLHTCVPIVPIAFLPNKSCAGGTDTEQLEEELAAQNAGLADGVTAHGQAGLVSFLVQPRIEIVSKDKLVASKGKFITVTGEGREGSRERPAPALHSCLRAAWWPVDICCPIAGLSVWCI